MKFLVALLIGVFGVSGHAFAQETSGSFQNSIKVGADSRACGASLEGAIRYNTTSDEMEFCDGADWVAPGAAGGSACTIAAGCSTAGDTCDDGTIYLGCNPTTLKSVYASSQLAGSYPFNNGNSSNPVLVGASNYFDGKVNSDLMLATDSDSGTAGVQPHQSAEACDAHTEFGHSDWYLPSLGEVLLMQQVGIDQTYQATSTEYHNQPSNMMYVLHTSDYPYNRWKWDSHVVICVRSE